MNHRVSWPYGQLPRGAERKGLVHENAEDGKLPAMFSGMIYHRRTLDVHIFGLYEGFLMVSSQLTRCIGDPLQVPPLSGARNLQLMGT